MLLSLGGGPLLLYRCKTMRARVLWARPDPGGRGTGTGSGQQAGGWPAVQPRRPGENLAGGDRRSARPTRPSSATTTRATARPWPPGSPRTPRSSRPTATRTRAGPDRGAARRDVRRQPGREDRDRDRRDPVPQPGRRQGRGPHRRHAGQGVARIAPLHRPARQARRPLADLQRPRGARPAGQPARPAQGPRVDGRRLGRRGARLVSGSTAAGRRTATS